MERYLLKKMVAVEKMTITERKRLLRKMMVAAVACIAFVSVVGISMLTHGSQESAKLVPIAALRCLDFVEAHVVHSVETMVSHRRREATFFLAVQSLTNVPLPSAPSSSRGGSFLEAGVASGGTAVIMASVMACVGPSDGSTLYLADSWEGLQPNIDDFPADKEFKKGSFHRTYESYKAQFSKWTNFWNQNEQYENQPWSSVRVVELRGMFKDTMSVEDAFGELQFLRCDGDMYESTYQCLEFGYPKLLPGGYVYMDDVGAFRACYQSVFDFRRDFGVANETAPIYWILEKGGNDRWPYSRDLTEKDMYFAGDRDGVQAGFWRKPLSEDPSVPPQRFSFEKLGA